MKLLLITQTVDKKDTFLSFMHAWINKFASEYETITVVCLKSGEHQFPKNVRVLSLGKETLVSRFKYVKNFYKYIFSENKNYDTVLVHMNQEYIILGGIFWKIMGKNIFMWRNHHMGNWITNIAVGFCKKVFCTSRFSYTARFKKTILMPVGVDINVFKTKENTQRIPNSILFIGRIAPVKKLDILIDALDILNKQNINFTASFVGDPVSKDLEYYDSLKKKITSLNLVESVSFFNGVSNDATVDVYNKHDICVNLSPSGMFDKTIFEAMACGALSISSNTNLINEISEVLIFKEESVEDLASKFASLFLLSNDEKNSLRRQTREYVEKHHSLISLSTKLSVIMSGIDKK